MINLNLRNKRALRLPQVLEITGLSKTQIYRLVHLSQFPAPKNLSTRVVAWDSEEVNSWLIDRFSVKKGHV